MQLRETLRAADVFNRFSATTLVLLAVLTLGCDRLKAKKPVTQKRKTPPAASASASPVGSAPKGHPAPPTRLLPSASLAQQVVPEGGNDLPTKYALPFAWEREENDPLAKTRAFLKEMFRDNRDYMKHGPRFFEAFAKAQKPRATVVACSDSRVQNAAWDISPENDNFTIRNIGNQIINAQGSVEYGIEHLNTSLLLIVGHTGCGAVKAAMGETEHLSPAIKHELESMQIPADLQGQTSDSAWSQAVIANVHAQVRVSLNAFGPLVHEGRLTIVGVVYDFRNDLGKGKGKITIVDVNGNSEQARLDAFVTAVTSGTIKDEPSVEGPPTDLASPLAPEAQGSSIDEITKKLRNLER